MNHIILLFSLALLLSTTANYSAEGSSENLSDRLNEKLSAQWDRFEDAQNVLIARMGDEGLSYSSKSFTRLEWEQLLHPPEGQELSAQDLLDLSAYHSHKIELARQAGIAESVIDLREIRNSGGVAEFCKTVPKGGMLHVHPFGTFSRKFVHRQLTQLDPELNISGSLAAIQNSEGNSILQPQEIDFLRSIENQKKYSDLLPQDRYRYQEFLFLPFGKQSFERFNSVFQFLNSVVSNWDHYSIALLEFAARAKASQLQYVEFTTGFNPKIIPHLEEIEKRYGIIIRINRSFQRTQTAETLYQQAQEFLKLPQNKFLVGIDFLDNEKGHSALEKGQGVYGSLLAAVKKGKSSLRRTMHSGELGEPRNPRDSILLGSERLGHGILLEQDVVALEYAAIKKIPIEINLVSNLRLTAVTDIASHPFLKYLRLGIPVSFSTDDEGIFDTSIEKECSLAIERTDISYAEYKRMAIHSLVASFVDSDTKARLIDQLRANFVRFESEWNSKLN